MSEEEIEMDDPTQAETAEQWRPARAKTLGADRLIADAVDIDAGDGPASGTIRILVAAVQRLSDENMRLADEVARLRKGETTTIYGGFNPEGMSETAREKLLAALYEAEFSKLPTSLFGSVTAAPDAPPADGRGLEAIADPEALGSMADAELDAPHAALMARSTALDARLEARQVLQREIERWRAGAWLAAQCEIERESAAADVEAHRAEVERAEYQAAVDRHMVSSPLMAEIRRQMDDAAQRHVDDFLKAALHGGRLVITFAPLRDGDAENDELPEARVMVDGVEITVETLEMDGFPGLGVRLPPFEDGVEDIPDAAESEIVIWWDEDAPVWCARAQGISSVMAFGVSDSDCKAASGLFEVLRHYVKMRQMYIDNGYSARALDRAADLVAREDELMSTLFLRPAAAEHDFSVGLGVHGGDDADTAADYRPEVGR